VVSRIGDPAVVDQDRDPAEQRICCQAGVLGLAGDGDRLVEERLCARRVALLHGQVCLVVANLGGATQVTVAWLAWLGVHLFSK